MAQYSVEIPRKDRGTVIGLVPGEAVTVAPAGLSGLALGRAPAVMAASRAVPEARLVPT
jgi:hypothetical protein